MGRNRPAVGRTTLTREERRALKLYHLEHLKEAEALVEAAREPFKAAQAELTRRFNLAKADGFERKRMTRLLADMRARTRDLVKEELERLEDQDDCGLPNPASQPDLFASATGTSTLPTASQDEIYWRAEGYRQGIMGGEQSPPAECQAAFHQAYMGGFSDGQKYLGEQFIAGQKIVETRGQAPADDQTDGEAHEEDEDQLDVEAEANRLRESGFLEVDHAAEDEVHDEAPEPAAVH